MAPKLRKQADDSQVGQTPEDENNVNSKENEQVEGLQIGPETRTGQDLNTGIGQSSRMNTRSKRTVHVDDPKNPEVGGSVSSSQFAEMIATFKELAQTQKLMLQKLEEQSGLRHDPLPSFEKDKGEASTSKFKSRPGKEPINVDDIPESWYEPAKTHDYQAPKPKKVFKQNTNVPFEPNFDGLNEDKGFRNNDYGFDEYVFTPGSHFNEKDRTSAKRFNPEIGIPKYAGIPEMGRVHSNYLYEPLTKQEGGFKQHRPFDDPFQKFPEDHMPRNTTWEPPVNSRVPLEERPALRDEILGLMQEVYGPLNRGVQTQIYRKPYPEWIDRQFEVPRGFKIPDFTLFHGDGKQSTTEHIARFTAQCKELGNNGFVKLKLFSNSLTGTAFKWYSNLTPESVPNWQRMEELFHAQFYQTEPEVTMADLARLKQKPDEKAAHFIARFKKARNKCKLQLPEVEFVRIAQDGLSRELRKKFDSTEFRDLVDLTYKASRYESLLEEDVDRNNSSYSSYYKDSTYEIDAAEIVEHDPCVCECLVRKDSFIAPRTNKKAVSKVYSFDVSKADEIFDYLLKKKFIKLPENVKLPTLEETKGKNYCKWHASWTHSTKNCNVFRDRVQEQIKKGRIMFPEKTMGIDTDPFPKIEEVTVNTNVPTSLAKTVQEVWQNRRVHVGMNSIQFGRGKPKVGQLRGNDGKTHRQDYATGSSSKKGFKQSHLPMLEACFLECLCMECRANYLIFKDLDRHGVDFFPKRMERKALDQNNERKPWISPSHGRNEKPWPV
ncbi:hypothetical protein Vadar_007900 [Vaccinium darrowii]|uniref:Uncharacterized protein n=1 Tax=Vaccinium darrowii TaxID=229202 RepID=A0ACB7XG32_9ERIC|nr:hypothetical protein Vadar_007900 [Vaccinium darrowii]